MVTVFATAVSVVATLAEAAAAAAVAPPPPPTAAVVLCASPPNASKLVGLARATPLSWAARRLGCMLDHARDTEP